MDANTQSLNEYERKQDDYDLQLSYFIAECADELVAIKDAIYSMKQISCKYKDIDDSNIQELVREML